MGGAETQIGGFTSKTLELSTTGTAFTMECLSQRDITVTSFFTCCKHGFYRRSCNYFFGTKAKIMVLSVS